MGPGRLDFKHPPIAIGGIREAQPVAVGWTLSIPRLPSGGFPSHGLCTVGWTLSIPDCHRGDSRAMACVDTDGARPWHREIVNAWRGERPVSRTFPQRRATMGRLVQLCRSK